MVPTLRVEAGVEAGPDLSARTLPLATAALEVTAYSARSAESLPITAVAVAGLARLAAAQAAWVEVVQGRRAAELLAQLILEAEVVVAGMKQGVAVDQVS